MNGIKNHLSKINQILLDLNLNSLIVAESSINENLINQRSPCIAFSCIFEYSVPLLIAASRIAPKCVFCVLEPHWLHLDGSLLYLIEGIFMDANGQAYYTQLNPNKRLFVSYFCNFYIYPSVWNSENQIEFLNIELKTDCPKSSSLLLAHFTNDKLYTRILASNKGINVPKCIAFVFDTKKYETLPSYEKHFIIKISKDDVNLNDILKCIEDVFPKNEPGKVVIKPSGSKFKYSLNVFY